MIPPSGRTALFDVSHPEIREAVRRALEEDIGTGDVTTEACVGPDALGRGRFLARETQVIAGMELLELIYGLRGGVEELRILAGGGALHAKLAVKPWEVGLQVGLASGDKDGTDNRWHTMRLDRDYDVALLMFEHPMPQYQIGDAADPADGPLGNVDASSARVQEGVSNALFLKPRFRFDILPNLQAGIAFVAAWPVVPVAFGHTDDQRRDFYGAEIDGDVTFTLHEAFQLKGTAGFLFPGSVFTDGRAFTFGGELRALVRF